MALRNRSSYPMVPALLLFAAAAIVGYHLMKKKKKKSGTSGSSSSSASNTTPATANYKYEVFLSFRGGTVPKDFVHFLSRVLKFSGIRVCNYDDVEEGAGNQVSVLEDIEGSKVYIPILSAGYVSSKWCLRELAHMVKCCKRGNEANIILPIFYMTDPRDAWTVPEACYGNALDSETIKEWMEALKEVGKMDGWCIKGSDRQGPLIDQIASKVQSHLTSTGSVDDDHLIGTDSHVDKVKELPSPSLLPSSSSSATTTQPLHAPVFVSFLVRNNFTDFLSRVLDHSCIRTNNLDGEEKKLREVELETDQESIFKAIEDSEVYIPVLSVDYASSKWCLRELAHMVKCCERRDRGHRVILPVFYMVDPRNIRHEEVVSYEKAFRSHGEKHDGETIKEWKEALKVVGTIKGWCINECDNRQGRVIDKVLSKVQFHLTTNSKLVTDELIGIDSHVGKVKKLLQLEYTGVKIIGIHGIPGIGKTSIARALYNEVCGQFDRCCFTEHVQETLMKIEGIVGLQKKIILSILQVACYFDNVYQGLQIIRDRFSRHKILIVLDDVDDERLLDEVLGRLDNFGPGSRIVVTTRNRRISHLYAGYEVYEPEGMSEDDSLQLFSKHAFGVDRPPSENIALSMEFVNAAAGLPLAIKLIGSLLFGRDQSFWEATLKGLEDVLPSEVQDALRNNYLKMSREEKQIFLDIAAVFTGEEKEGPFWMWHSCLYQPVISIHLLTERHMIKLNDRYHRKEANKGTVFWMYDHVRDLGRAIIREENPLCPWNRSRIWSNEDALHMLTNGKGSNALEVLKVDMQNITLKLTDRHFKALSGLRYLEVLHGEFEGSFDRILPKLRWLRLFHCISVPMDFSMEELVVLQLYKCQVVTDDFSGWENIKAAHKLKALYLWHCNDLIKDLNLSGCQNLELLYFNACKNMTGELNIGKLRYLELLKLVDTKITELTGDIGMLQHLYEIHVESSGLTDLPDGIGTLPHLEILHMVNTTSDLKLKKMASLPTSLKKLNLQYVSSPNIPNLSDLKNLVELWLNGYEHPLPGDVWKLSKLKFLKLSGFHSESLLVEEEGGSLPSALEKLEIRDSKGLKRLPSLENLSNLTELVLYDTGLCEVAGLSGLRMLEILRIRKAPNLTSLEDLEHLTLVKELSLEECGVLAKLPSLWNMTKLEELKMDDCRLLFRFVVSFQPEPFLSNLGNLRTVYLSDTAGGDVNVDNPQEQILNLSGLHSLHKLSIFGFGQLAEIKGLESSELLESLNIEDCTSLRKSPDLLGKKNIKKLSMNGCKQLSEVVGLEDLESLQNLYLKGCTSFNKLPDLSRCKHLMELDVSGCTQLTRVTGIDKLKELTRLTIDDILNIPPLKSQVNVIRK